MKVNFFWCQSGSIFKSQNARKLHNFKTTTVVPGYIYNLNFYQFFFLVGNEIIITQISYSSSSAEIIITFFQK